MTFCPKFIVTDEMNSIISRILECEAKFPKKPTPTSHPKDFYIAYDKYIADSFPLRAERRTLIKEWETVATRENPEWVKHFGIMNVGYWG